MFPNEKQKSTGSVATKEQGTMFSMSQFINQVTKPVTVSLKTKPSGERIEIPVGNEKDGTYQVTIGRNLLTDLVAKMPVETDRVMVVYPETMAASAEKMVNVLQQAGKIVATFIHPDGEQAKQISVLEQAWMACAQAQLTRTDCIVALGGGATTDLGGFVAATWLRGIKLINCPTTLLAMVDAAIGGKTGINTPTGKNLVGSFYPPVAVLCDLDYLATLPPADLRSGMGEVLKTGYIADPKIIELIRADQGHSALMAQSKTIMQLVAHSVAVKAYVVSADLKEGGLREILNYGHTLAHAIEKASEYQWRHGEAVAVGMVYAARLAQELGVGSAQIVNSLINDLQCLGLPTEYSAAEWEEVHRIMASDKKVRHGQLRFVLLQEVAQPVVQVITDLAQAKVTYQQLA